MMTCSICRTDPCRATVARAIMDTVPLETKRLLWGRRLSQTCPTCGHIEPAGLTCSKCSGSVLPEQWDPDSRRGRSGAGTQQSTRRDAIGGQVAA